MSKKYLPGMAKGFSSPKLTLNVGDGFEFMKQNQNAFDVIITDSSDPVGKEPEIGGPCCAISPLGFKKVSTYLFYFSFI